MIVKLEKLSVKNMFSLTETVIKFSQNLAFENHRMECELLKDIFPVVPSENARLIAQLFFKTRVPNEFIQLLAKSSKSIFCIQELKTSPQNNSNDRQFQELVSRV